MTRQAEAEAWIRKPKRLIHNQLLMQLLAILIIIIPLPSAGVAFWLVFAVCPSLVISGIVGIWILAVIIYASLSVFARIKLRHSL